MDLGVKLTIIGTISADIKYELYNDGTTAAAIGGGLGYVNVTMESGSGDDKRENDTAIFDAMVPLYLSYRVTPLVALYAAPKIVHRMLSGSATGNTTLFGSTAGVMWGKTSGVAGEVTYLTDGDEFDMMQVAGGVFF